MSEIAIEIRPPSVAELPPDPPPTRIDLLGALVLVVVLVLFSCAGTAREREVVATMSLDTCGAASLELEQLAEHLVVSAWDLGTRTGGTTFGTDSPSTTPLDCPADTRYRLQVEPVKGGLFSGTIAIGAINRCTLHPICIVVYEIMGEAK